MSDKLVELIAWQLVKWYVRRQVRRHRVKLALGAILALAFAGVAAGVIASQRQSEDDSA